MDYQELLHSQAKEHWKKIGASHHHGINLLLSSLHSAKSSGIGEFLDLLPLIDWCASIGLDVIQLLPLNDVGCDTSPYNAISAFALNPIHLSLWSLPYLDEFPDLKEKLNSFCFLNKSSRVNILEVRKAKGHFLNTYLQYTDQKFLELPEYQSFINSSSSWLKGYGLFKTLKSIHHWANWESWPLEYHSPTPDQLEFFYEKYHAEISHHSIIQFLCDQQMSKVKNEATAKGVFLMGDIPILIARDSADVWLERSLFLMEFEAGSPPDQYSKEGQKWGFPVYNWQTIAKTGYRWWIDRLQYATRFYDIFRIDHVVGFFRIWAIPFGKESHDGYFFPKDEKEWIPQGKEIMLMMLNNCSMLPIGEDLGTVPDEVRLCLKQLGICGTKVMRWERKWKKDKSYIPIQDYLPASLTTVSTHDSETLSLWWRNQEEEATLYAQAKGWSYQPQISREYLHQILWDSHHSGSLFHINLLNEYLALIPGMTHEIDKERINLPGIISKDNWTYRFRPSVEEIVDNQTLRHLMHELIV